MKPHNLGPAGWMDKIKRPDLQRRAISMKGAANGRKKPSYHFWTKSKIKDFIKKRVKHQAEVRKQRAALPLRNLGRGARRMKWTWLPSVLEQKLIDAEKERLAEEKAREDAEKAAADKATKEEAGGEDGEGSGGGGGDESGGGGGDDDAGDGGGSGGGGGGGDDDDEDGSNPFGGMSF